MTRPPNNTRHVDIVKAQLELIRRLGNARDTKFNSYWYLSDEIHYFTKPNEHIEELIHTCWACGMYCTNGVMTRCHIIPHCYGGADEPTNYLLLCDYCHEIQPDESDTKTQIQWLLSQQNVRQRRNEASAKLINEIKELPAPKNIHNEMFAVLLWYNAVNTLWLRACKATGSYVKRVSVYHNITVELAKRLIKRYSRRLTSNQVGYYTNKINEWRSSGDTV